MVRPLSFFPSSSANRCNRRGDSHRHIVAFLLLYSDMHNDLGDLVLVRDDGRMGVKVVHPREVKYLAPASVRREAGRQVVRFDFLPSSQSTIPTTFIGGTWEVARGALIQETGKQSFTVNQIQPGRSLDLRRCRRVA